MQIAIPQLCLVALIGASGSGKSSFARRHFLPTEVVSSDACRGWISDDENDQAISAQAFDLLYHIVAQRLTAGRLTVVDATNVRPEDRKRLIEIARRFHVFAAAIVFDLPDSVCNARNAVRHDRQFGEHVVRNQNASLRRSVRHLQREGFRYLARLSSVEAVDAATITRTRLWNDRREDGGPFDLIGDVHGCRDELVALLQRLGYEVGGTREAPQVQAPAGRRALFLGDLVDRGPDSPGVLRLVMHMVGAGLALCVPGNHDVKLMKKLGGANVRLTHGLAETMQQLEGEDAAFLQAVAKFVDGLVSHLVLDQGRLVVAHAGMKQELQGRSSGRVREFALYGESTGETDEFGLPVRYEWANDYRGSALVVYGHTPVPEPEWINNTLCIDTGCVFGGRLTALRYPERELVSVAAAQVYYAPVKPFASEAKVAAPREAPLPDLGDVSGKRTIDTRLHPRITVRAENATAALEVMSRFTVDPRWLVYLPPTMAPPETAADGALLERPQEAIAAFRHEGVPELVAQEKHMGSRAVIVLCRDESVAQRRFGIGGDGRGVIYTRSGRRFFADRALEQALLDRLDTALERAGLWQELATDWLLLDAELLPWSAKAQELLQQQYAPTGAAATTALDAAQRLLAAAAARGVDTADALAHAQQRLDAAQRFVDAYGRYCWSTRGIADLRIAPFHVLACEGVVGLTRPHRWHMDLIGRLAAADPELLRATAHRYIDLCDEDSVAAAVAWWEELTASGGEGIVLKPSSGVARGARGLLQPAVKCRGREYLRIIYGPEYTAPQNLSRLRHRGVRRKQGLALREFALGVESLQRFVEHEPPHRVHECVFAVLALESEPTDARL